MAWHGMAWVMGWDDMAWHGMAGQGRAGQGWRHEKGGGEETREGTVSVDEDRGGDEEDIW